MRKRKMQAGTLPMQGFQSHFILENKKKTGILIAFSALCTPTGENTRSSANPCVFLFLSVHPWICCPANQHSAHPHVRMVEGLWREPVQILPASHLHPHAARPMYCDPSKGRLQPALHPPQTRANQEGLGEGEIREVCSAQHNRGVFERGDL